MQDFILPVTVAGLNFKNPFYVASGPTARTVEQLLRIEKAGWAAASIKLSIDPKPYINRVPRYAVFKQYNALAFTAEKRLTFDQGLKLVNDAKKSLSELLVMANITYAGDDGPEGWVRMAKAFEAAGADIIEFNMCCPNMSFNAQVTSGDEDACTRKTGASLGKNAAIVSEISLAVKQSIRIPLFVKLTPEGGEIAEVAQALYRVGVNAVGGTGNRLGIPPIDLENPGKAIYHLQDEISMSCYSSAWLKPLAQRDTYEIRKVCGPQAAITATGGIRNAADAIEMAMCGADLLGICSETLIRGYDFIGDVIAETRDWLKAHGHQQLRAIRDQIVPTIRSAPDLTLYDGYAVVTEPALSAPCQASCPAGVPIQTLMKKTAERKFDEAEALLSNLGPLQELCGRLCDAPCEYACVKERQTKHLQIRAIERFLAQRIREKSSTGQPVEQTPKADAKRIYIRDRSLAGISCAHNLAQWGYAVTIGTSGDGFYNCLPESRLPSEVLDFAVTYLDRMGVTCLSKPLSEEESHIGFDAAYHPAKAIVADASIPGAIPALAVFEMRKSDEEAFKRLTGCTVTVLGNGILSAEAARMLRENGCSVTIMTTAETPSNVIRELENEHISIISGMKDFSWKENKISATQKKTGACLLLPCDQVVDANEVFERSQERAGVWTDRDFAPSLSPARLIAAGKKAALSIHQHFMLCTGTPLETASPVKKPVVQFRSVLARSAFPIDEKTLHFSGKQQQTPISNVEAVEEANRCLRCGCGEGCDICRTLCCEFAIALNEEHQISIDPQKCVACGMCFNLCPNKNIAMFNLGTTL